MRLPFLFTLPRVLRHSDAIGADLPPDEAVVVDPPDPQLLTAVAAAAAGDHTPARELLAATREHAQWERRDEYVRRLARTSLNHYGWLDSWLDESPRDPDGVLVKADACVQRAWKIRTAARAEDVERDQFQAFFALLEDAVAVIGAAASLNPADPVPWRIALTQARGIQAPREVFEAYRAEADARDRYHFGCQEQALQYVCEKWYGSHEEMFTFAEHAAWTAPPGSKLHALPLQAVVEYQLVSDEEPPVPDPYAARIEAALTRALDLSETYEPGDREAAGFRNHLALLLLNAGRPQEALDMFRAIGVHATEYPWAYTGDPRTEFLETRAEVRVELAMKVPFFSRPPRPPEPEPDWSQLAPRALAIVSARPPAVTQAALICGFTLRTAPAGDHHTYVEVVPEPARTTRSTLVPAEPLTAAAANFTTAETWPALILHRTPERSAFTLLHKGKAVAAHAWDTTSPAPDHTEVTATAARLARAYDLRDPRPLAHILRATGDPVRHQRDLVAALGLPPIPTGFGDGTETLGALPGARVLARRGILAGMRDTMAADHGSNPLADAPDEPRPLRWWLLRIVGLLAFTAAAVYGWWSPDIGWFRSTASTGVALYLAVRLLRNRPARGRDDPS